MNIKAVIQLYEEKKIDGFKKVWVMDGKVVTEEEARESPESWIWEEVRFLEFIPCFCKDSSNSNHRD
jgi:hypothetical protein